LSRHVWCWHSGFYDYETIDENEMADNLEYLSANLVSVIGKERSLLKNGYRKTDLTDEHLLDSGEYLVRSPYQEDTGALRGWESLSIIWRTF
jgi:hypothetical protein